MGQVFFLRELRGHKYQINDRSSSRWGHGEGQPFKYEEIDAYLAAAATSNPNTWFIVEQSGPWGGGLSSGEVWGHNYQRNGGSSSRWGHRKGQLFKHGEINTNSAVTVTFNSIKKTENL